VAEAVVTARPRGRAVAAAYRRLRRAIDEGNRGHGRVAERDPGERPRLDTLDDWILFGPRMH